MNAVAISAHRTAAPVGGNRPGQSAPEVAPSGRLRRWLVHTLQCALALALCCTPLLGDAAALDVDGDGQAAAATDGQLVLRHLLGFRDGALTGGLLGGAATRDAAAVQAYLEALAPALDVDGDGRADALSDGLLILRRLQGRSGAALTDGVVGPGALLDAAGIAARIDLLRTPPGEAPAQVALVQANALTPASIQLDWLPTFDNDTPGSGIAYVLHAAETDNFVPDAASARAEVVDDATGIIDGLAADTLYYVKVEARDAAGHRSWSNQLAVRTAALPPAETASPKQVLDNQNAPEQQAEPERVEYRLGPGAAPPQVGDILVSAAGDGFLRRAAAVAEQGDAVSVDTEPAALNEVFSELSLSTDIKLVDLPEAAGPSARAVGRGVLFQRSGDTVRAVWPDSGLTLIEQRPSRPRPRAAAGAGCDGKAGTRVSESDRPLKVTFPESVCVEPNKPLEIAIDVEIDPALAHKYQVTQLQLEKLTHAKVPKAYSNYGAHWQRSLGSGDTSGTGFLRWTPQARHVDDQGRPYKAQFIALAKERSEYCGFILDFCGERKIRFEVDVYVAWGELTEPGDQAFSSAGANLSIAGSAGIAFEPRVRTDVEVRGSRLDYGRVLIDGPIVFTTRLGVQATAAASHENSLTVFDKRFVKVYFAGQVPIVITGRFQLRLEYRATADAALDLTQQLDIGYDIEAGLEYRDGHWRLIREAQPWQRYRLTGEADTRAEVDLRFVPDLELAFYDMVTGRLIVEPYLYAEAALEGHFLYQVDNNGDGLSAGTDTDYRFTRLEFGGGIDAKFRAGLEVFDQSIVGYPSRDKDDFHQFALLDRTPILGLPDLAPRLSTARSSADCTAVGLGADIADVPNPFQALFGGPPSFNPFSDESAAWQVVLPKGHERIGRGSGNRDAFFSAASAGQYRLRFSGHSALGSFVRQYQDITIDYDPSAQDCAGALTVHPPSGNWITSPQQLATSGADTLYYRMVNTYDGTTPPDPSLPTPSSHDGVLNGPNASFSLYGSAGQLKRSKLVFVGCDANACGAPAGPFEYGIDLRPRVSVTPATGNWTTSPQQLTVTSPGGYNSIYYTMVNTYDGTEPAEPASPSPAYHDGMLTGPTASFGLYGSDGQLKRSKLRFVACSGQSCGPASGSLPYSIDLTRPEVPRYPLNDTGITWCANGSTNFLDCPVADYPWQDAQDGRDATHNDDSDGHAGFSFTKLDANGNPLPASATQWSCVRDNVTGLIWEVKTDDGGLRDKDWTYSWYNPDANTNGGSAGSADRGNNCYDPARCDTHKYVADVNSQGLCGASDWRLASVDELLSIVSNDRINPAIDTDYFPKTIGGLFWSSSPYAPNSSNAWSVCFYYGNVGNGSKSSQTYVRLVRGGQ
jgi:hypothetical protein